MGVSLLLADTRESVAGVATLLEFDSYEQHTNNDVIAFSKPFFNGIFVTNSVDEFGVGIDLLMQLADFFDKFRVRLLEFAARAFVAGVEHGAVGKDNASRNEFFVAVGVGAAVHSRSIVDNNTSDHSRLLRSRVGRENFAVWLEDFVDTFADDARL